MSGSSVDPEAMKLLLEAKAQIETDAVELDRAMGWFQALPKMIEQNRMPKVWERITAFLRKHGHEAGNHPRIDASVDEPASRFEDLAERTARSHRRADR
jgi:hypothetical protein